MLKNNLKFSTLFSINKYSVNDVYKKTITMLGLEKYTNFKTVSDNYENILKENDVVGDGPEDSKLVDVPGWGDCSIIALLSPVLGFVIDRKVSKS